MHKYKFAWLLFLSLGCNVAIKEEVLKISGVSTTPNEYGLLPPGSLKRGVNVVFRRPGVMEALPAYTSYATHSGSTVKMFAGDTKTFALEGDANLANIGAIWEPAHTGGVGTSFTYGSTVHTNSFSPGKVGFTKNRDRYFFTEDSLVYVMDAEDGAARLAGLPAPSACKWISETTVPVGSGITNGNLVKYTAIFFREQGNYSFRSAPCSIIYTSAGVADAAPNIRVYWSKIKTNLIAGDKVELYRSDQGGPIDAIADEFSLAQTHVLDSTDLSNGYATIEDRCSDDGLGQALYTNQFQAGATLANYMPPTSRDVTTFRGATLYATKSTWATASAAIRGQGMGNLITADAIANGIGARSFQANIVNGSPVTVATTSLSGIVVGQLLLGTTFFPAGTTIISIVGTTVTMSANAIGATSLVTLLPVDVLVVNGKNIRMDSEMNATTDMATQNTGVNLLSANPYTSRDGLNGLGQKIAATGYSFALVAPVPDGTVFTLSATNPQNYSPPMTSVVVSNDPRTNRVYFSKVQQPEAVSPLSYIDVGSGTILRLVATESCVYAFCTDGTYRITGDGVNWRVDPFDPTLFLYHPDALDIMDNTIYAWTCEGLSAIDDSGSRTISANVQVDVRELLSLYQAGGLLSQWGLSVACDDQKKEVFFGFNNQTLPAESQVTYIYNTITGDITTADIRSTESPMCFSYLPFIPAIAVGNSAGIFKPQATPGVVEEADVEFNPLWASQLGDLKQWMSLVLHWGTITPPDIGAFDPTFDDNNVLSYPIIGDEETVVPVPRRAATSKRLNFGFRTEPEDVTNYFQLTGITVRYRNSSETLKR